MPAPTSAPASDLETIEFIKKGQVTIPKKVRDKYKIVPGQKGMLIELGGGFLILPIPSPLPALLDEIREGLGTSEMSLQEMIAEMRRIRETSDYEVHA